MKRRAFFYSLISVYMLSGGTVLGQKKGCDFNIVGTWEVATADRANSQIYRFAEDGTVIVLSNSGKSGSAPREIAAATYKLDYPKAPKAISFNATKGGGVFAEGTTSVQLIGYDDSSFTCQSAGSEPTRWVRVDNNQYFLVLAGRKDVFYDHSGPVFPMMIKRDGKNTEIDAVGIYSLKGNAFFGLIPEETYKSFMKETRSESDVMLRLELTSAQYERGLKVVQTWERRFREGALLYDSPSLNNIMLLKQLGDSLSQCGGKFKVHNLDWSFDDRISYENPVPVTPFLFVKEMKRLNESFHVKDAEFHKHTRPAQQSKGK